MAERADWSGANLRHFIDICKGEIEAGFNRASWEKLVDKFEEKNRKEYTWFMELKNAATGLGWDDAKQTVDCAKEWWDEHLARCNNPEKGIKCNHMRFQKHGPKHLDDLHIMFGKIHVSGTTAICPGDILSDESSNDDDVTKVTKTSDAED
ncbi:unnamed protein product [Miscanthus lutarioriparius]|uniref:Myb/SANT-like domain-containing protein n=1 Tax=Miscanthus lutarioriparius TaxID=422564 RepID=A0A811SK78_9POAL|nr:unnamed protein product [Miscanthus lutarioriparius]